MQACATRLAAAAGRRASGGRLRSAWNLPHRQRRCNNRTQETDVIHCVLHDPDDSVAVVVVEGIKAGTALTGLILDEDRTIQLECRQDIPIGHKVALKDMAVGDTVIKYGVDIGKVVQPIRKGEHAHVHNIKTKRW
jgi:(2R)-sulfolactate sulfo-lyase subunit alpha